LTSVIARWGQTVTTGRSAYGRASNAALLSHNIQLKQKKLLHGFKYDKSKAEEYQLTLTTSPRNMRVVDSIGHLGADELTDLLQHCMGVRAKVYF
jgi:aspartate oxidase